MSKKGQKMSLTSFLADESLGAWADDVADLPTARTYCLCHVVHVTNPSMTNKAVAAWTDSSSRGPVDTALSRPVPTSPPFVLYMGNLDYEVSDSDIQTLFGDQVAIKSIRIIRDIEGKPKGFGYVELEDHSSILGALKMNGESLRNRRIKLDVSDQSSSSGRGGERRQGGGFDDAKFDGVWRRDGPPPEIERRSMSGSGGDRPPRDSYRSEDTGDWRSSANARPPPMASNTRHPMEPRPADDTKDWRSAARPPPIDRPPMQQQSSHQADDTKDWRSAAKTQRDSHLSSPVREQPKREEDPRLESANTWRREKAVEEVVSPSTSTERGGQKPSREPRGEPREQREPREPREDRTAQVDTWRAKKDPVIQQESQEFTESQLYQKRSSQSQRGQHQQQRDAVSRTSKTSRQSKSQVADRRGSRHTDGESPTRATHQADAVNTWRRASNDVPSVPKNSSNRGNINRRDTVPVKKENRDSNSNNNDREKSTWRTSSDNNKPVMSQKAKSQETLVIDEDGFSSRGPVSGSGNRGKVVQLEEKTQVKIVNAFDLLSMVW